jgi:hypothetical protein
VLLLMGQQRLMLPLGNDRFVPISIIGALAGVALLLISALFTAVTYLQTGFRSQIIEDSNRLKSEVYRLQARSPDGRSISNTTRIFETDRVLGELSALKDKVAQLETATTGNTDEQIAAVAEQLTERVLDAGGEELLRRADDRVRAEIEKIRAFQTIKETFDESKARLSSEIARLERKSNFNLSLGGLTTVLGIGLLGYAVFFHQQRPASVEGFAMAFAPASRS